MISRDQFIDWFETFLEEKKLPEKNWEIESPITGMNLISSDVVIEHIKATTFSEQKSIRDIIVKIDFANGDVNHFFKHLATGLVAKRAQQ